MKKNLLLFFVLLLTFNSNAQCWEAIDTGLSHTLAIKSDGTLWAWGLNNYGQLGNNSNTSSNIPIQIGTGTDWISVAGGYFHSLAIKTDGTLWGWGNNSTGQLGDGTTVNKLVPTQIGTNTNWIKVSTSGNHTAAITTNNTLWMWGRVIGIFDFSSIVSTPTQVGTNWKEISLAYRASVGIKTDGTLWFWGNTFDSTSVLSPFKIGNATNWSKVDCGYLTAMALKNDGTLWIWGSWTGLGAIPGTSIPTQIGNDTWKDFTTSVHNAAGLKTDGSLWTWGGNDYGQLGDGTLEVVNIPKKIGTQTDWQQVKMGYLHTIAIQNDGTLFSWGSNQSGLLGHGSSDDSVVNQPLALNCPSLSILKNADIRINLYPNPTNNILYFDNTLQQPISKISITDITGKIVLEQKHQDVKSINVDKLKPGLYFAQIKILDKVYKEKFIKL